MEFSVTGVTTAFVVHSASIFKDKRDFPAANPFLDRCGRELMLRFGGTVIAVGEATGKGEEDSPVGAPGAFEKVLELSIMFAVAKADLAVLCPEEKESQPSPQEILESGGGVLRAAGNSCVRLSGRDGALNGFAQLAASMPL